MAPGQPLTTRPLRRDDWPVIEAPVWPQRRLRRLLVHVVARTDGRQDVGSRQGRTEPSRVQSSGGIGRRIRRPRFRGRCACRLVRYRSTHRFPRLERSKALARDMARYDVVAQLLVRAAPRSRPRRGDWPWLRQPLNLHASKGRREIEAYPQVLRPGERQAGAFVWTGVPGSSSRWASDPLSNPNAAALCICCRCGRNELRHCSIALHNRAGSGPAPARLSPGVRP